MLKFLKIHTDYPEYLHYFYNENPDLIEASFQQQQEALEQDGFFWYGYFARSLQPFGYSAQELVWNSEPFQRAWAREKGMRRFDKPHLDRKEMEEICLCQVEEIRPDVVWLHHWSHNFLQNLKRRVSSIKLVLGWVGSTMPKSCEPFFRNVDMLLSCAPESVVGASKFRDDVYHLNHWFDKSALNYLKDQPMKHDICFSGGLKGGSNFHDKRANLLADIASSFDIVIHSSERTEHEAIERIRRPPLFGLNMLQALKNSRIVLNAHADTSTMFASNLRMYEATGVGSCLLTDWKINMPKLFKPGIEAVTYTDNSDCLKQIEWLLSNPDKRNSIAKAGQQRCSNEHDAETRLAIFDHLIRTRLATITYPAKAPQPTVSLPMVDDGVDAPPDLITLAPKVIEISRHLISIGRYAECLHLTSRLKASHLSLPDLDLLRGQAFLSIGQPDSAREALKEELRYFPDNGEARRLLEALPAPSSDTMAGLPQEFVRLLKQVRPYTMLSTDRLRSLYKLAVLTCREDLPGNVVECGVAAGGSTALLAWVIKSHSKRPRKLFCFDTFEGMPNPTDADSHANTAANDTGWGVGTCAAPMQSLIDICKKLGVSDIIYPIKGLFKDTLPLKSHEMGNIAFLHMDGDWYESTRDILKNLYEQVIPQGYIQVDDYGHWDGCKKALHEYESKLGVRFDLHRIDNTGVWFRKPDSPDDTTRSRLLNLGCGKRHHPAWTNVDFKSGDPDVIAHDLNKGLPYSDESFEVIYHSHLLEHFSKNYAPVFLKDCFRVLKPGGIIRVVAPDLESIVRLYLLLLEKSVKGDAEAQKRYDWIMLELFDQMVRNHSGGAMLEYWRQNPMPVEDFVIERIGSEVKNAIAKIRSNPNSSTQPNRQPDNTLDPLKIGQFRLSGEIHQWMYDRYSLGKMLQEAGFVDIKVCKADESSIPDFNSYLLDVEPDGSVRKPDSLFMEARKPKELNTKIPSIHATSQNQPVIAQFCMQDFGGAGTAALRLHESLTRVGANNTLYVQNIGKWRDKTASLSQTHPSSKNEKFISPEWRAFQTRNQQALSQYPNRPSGLEMFTIPWAATGLKDIPELHNADIINLHWISGTLSVADNVDFLKGKKIVWTLHDMNPFTGGCHYAGECRGYEKYCGNCPQLGSNQENDLSREIWKIKKPAYKELDIEVVVLCDWMAKCVKRSSLLSSFPVHVIPNGLPTDVFKPYPQSQIRESLQIPKDAFVILFGADYVNNIRKGFHHLLRAMDHLKTITPDMQIALMTFGQHTESAVKQLSYPTFALDYIENESELALVYSMADVTVIPSLEDNLPNIVLESLACGTPVVGFDVGGIPDMVKHQVNGYLTRTGDHKGLAEGIRWVMEQKRTGSIGRLKCREAALSRYNHSLQSQRYRVLYEKILKK